MSRAWKRSRPRVAGRDRAMRLVVVVFAMTRARGESRDGGRQAACRSHLRETSVVPDPVRLDVARAVRAEYGRDKDIQILAVRADRFVARVARRGIHLPQ